jgi:MoxR-like ATPase
MAAKEHTDRVVSAMIKSVSGEKTRIDPAPAVEKKVAPLFLRTKDATAGRVMYSHRFGNPGKVGPDFDISDIAFADEDWPEEDRIHIPDGAKYEHHEVDHTWVYGAVLALKKNLSYLVVGPTGGGKTSGNYMICSRLRWPLLHINGRSDMESDTILGKVWVHNGTMDFKMGSFPERFKRGGMILVDEVMKIPAGIQMTLQRAYERYGELQLDDMPGKPEDKIIKRHTHTRIIFADNVVGTGDGMDKYSATLLQDSSFLNRIGLVFHAGYMPEEKEVALLMNAYDYLPKEWAHKMVQMCNLIRKGFQSGELTVPMSYRQLEAWAEYAFEYEDYRKSFDAVMLHRFAEDTEKGAVNELWTTVYGKVK